MNLDPETIRKLAKMTLETKPEHISCEDWIHRVGEYVEAQRSGTPMDERLRVVEHHTVECKSCAKELEVLRDIVDGEDD